MLNYTGNPLSYRDGMSFAWENGRILKSISTGDNTVTMKYDSNGIFYLYVKEAKNYENKII